MTSLNTTAPTVNCSGIAAAYEPKAPVLRGIDARFEAGRFTAVIGPNGSGKSTLLSCVARQLPFTGRVDLDGTDVQRMPRRAFAQQVAFLPQSPFAPEGVSVRGLVERGRTPYRHAFTPLSRTDHRAVDDSIDRLSLGSLAQCTLTDLSGGQRQRAWLALVLAQDTPVLLLDEPTAFLDLAHQADLLALCRSLATEGRTVIAVLHDLNLAAAFADDLLVIEQGRVSAFGAPHKVLTAEMLAKVYGLKAEIIPDPHTGAPVVLPRNHIGESTKHSKPTRHKPPPAPPQIGQPTTTMEEHK